MAFKMDCNGRVKAALSERGIEHMKARRVELNKKIIANGGKGLGGLKVKIDPDGYTEFQFWVFMNTFGPITGDGQELPFYHEVIFLDGQALN